MKRIILLLVLTLVAITNCDHYHILPIDFDCQNCFTLQQLCDTKLESFVDVDNLTLTLSPGQHILNGVLSFKNLASLKIKGHQNTTISWIKGSSIEIINTTKLVIDDVKFIQESTSESTTQGLQCGLKVSNTNKVKISNCRVTGFICSSSSIFDIQQTHYAQLDTVIFSNNTGKSLYIQSNTTNIENCRFSNLRGGAIAVESHGVNISNTEFINNYKQYEKISPVNEVTNDRNCYCDYTAALYLHAGTTSIFNSTFLNNNGRAICTETGHVFVSYSQFNKNRFNGNGGAICSLSGDINISNTMLANNNAENGGAICTEFGDVIISSSNLANNNAKKDGGAIATHSGTVIISDSTLTNNIADGHGGAIGTNTGQVKISESNLRNNNADKWGGVIATYSGNVNINDSNLANNTNKNHGYTGGVIATWFGNVTISYSNLTKNNATSGGVIATNYGTVIISNSYLSNNNAVINAGGVIFVSFSGYVIISDSIIINNSAAKDGGVIFTSGKAVNITRTTIANNTAHSDGGAIHFTLVGNAHLSEVILIGNTARNGGAIAGSGGIFFYLTNCSISYNSAHSDGGAIDVSLSTVYLSKTTLSNNIANRGGAIYAKSTATILVMQSSYIDNIVSISNNSAMSGGGIHLYKSILNVTGRVEIIHNEANDGGGIYSISLSHLKLLKGGATTITSNYAHRHGAGIYAVTSSIEIISANVIIEENRAMAFGGGIYLQHNAKLDFFRCPSFIYCDMGRLEMSHNTADYGGGIYVDDDTADSDICESTIHNITPKDCFIRNGHEQYSIYNQNLNYINVIFTKNTAKESGNDIFGGLLDRCKTHQSSEVSGISYIKKTLPNKSSISSQPVQVKLCNYRDAFQFTRRGQLLVINVTAIDQTDTPVPATIHSSLSSGSLKIEQERQNVKSACTPLEYNVFSNANYVLLDIYADGPCTNIGLSKTTINVTFQPCECPLGFEKSDLPAECNCECDSELNEYVESCSLEDGTIKLNASIWIGISEDSNYNINVSSPYIIHECPFDYCIEKPFDISLNRQEIDKQCANNRSGVLCGGCSDGLSLVLATSVCKECSNIYLLLIIPFAFAGIALVSFLLIFNITVASGTVQGLIFFANILAASKETFLPFSSPNFLTVFISWVNLDVGIQTCFYNGLNSQAKVLLQLVFPAYIFFLIFLIIIASKYSSKFSNLLSNRNPVAVLCTLILLSYSKVLRSIIAALQYTVVSYPDGEDHVVWMYDGNVNYFTGSHAPRFICAVIILLAGKLFSVLLLFGQCFPLCSKWKIMKWAKNTKYHAFMDAYHAPLTPRHRYWTGLLLFALIVQNFIAAMAPKKIAILSAGCIALGLIFLKLICNPVYKKWFIDYLETCFLLILVFLSYGTLYIGNANENQCALATISMTIAFVLFVVIAYYHICKFVLKSPKVWLNIAILAYGISNVPTSDQESSTNILATFSMISALIIVTGTVIYHLYTYLLKKPSCINIKKLFDIYDLELPNENKDKENNHKQVKADNQEYKIIFNVPAYDDEYQALSDPHRYITPPIVRPATKPDQLREPYLDILAPITEDDYKQAHPPPPVNIPPKPTYAIIKI